MSKLSARSLNPCRALRPWTKTGAIATKQGPLRCSTPRSPSTKRKPHVAAIIKVERDVYAYQPVTGLWKLSSEISFYLSSRPIAAIVAADAIRKHGGIENKSPYTRDVTFREDASRIRTNPGIVARLRSIAYNILRYNQSDTIPQDRFARALGGLKSMSAMSFTRER